MYTGYHHEDTLPIKTGDRVRIRKGTTVYVSYCDDKIAGRDHVVTVYTMFPGQNANGDIPACNPRVVWVGSGGYLHEADINLVERL